MKVKGQGRLVEKRDFFTRKKFIFPQLFFAISFTFDLEVKGHTGQGQRSHRSRSNKGHKQRQVGSRQCQVASFVKIQPTPVPLVSRGLCLVWHLMFMGM